MPTRDELATAYAGQPVRLPIGDNLRRPWCWNRPPYPDGEWNARQGHHEALAVLLRLRDGRSRWRWTGQRWEMSSSGKPRYRWRPNKMSRCCRAWDCGPSETPAPVTDRYDCRGCRWMPERARVHFGESA